MRKRLLTAVLSAGMLAVPLAVPSVTAAAQYYDSHGHYYSSQQEYYRHKEHMKAAKHIGIGAAGGAVAGGLIGGGTGALVGGGLGAGGGYLYHRHWKHHHYPH
jgi:hypothetical protein